MSSVLITGGNGDIARSIRELLIDEGFNVFSPGKAELDVTNIDSIKCYFDKYTPDVLINNAGYVVPKSIRKGDYAETKKHIDINLIGTFWCTQVGLSMNPNLSVINIASAAAVEAHATWSEYCASKAAVVMATKCWAEDGIYAIAISPGRTKTKMRKSLFPNEDQNTLLDPKDFAKIVFKAVRKEYPSGTHVIVRKQNVQQLLLKNDLEV